MIVVSFQKTKLISNLKSSTPLIYVDLTQETSSTAPTSRVEDPLATNSSNTGNITYQVIKDRLG
jgi:hypothetical protein